MKPSITISVTHMPAVKYALLLPTITLNVKPHPKLLIPEVIIYTYIASEHQPYKYIPLLILTFGAVPNMIAGCPL
jgi:hypothetical protein